MPEGVPPEGVTPEHDAQARTRAAEGDNRAVRLCPAADGDGPAAILWRRRWTVLATVAVFLAAAAIYLTQVRPLYRSTAVLYVERSGPRILSESEGVMTRSQNYLHTQAELLRSTPILSAALNVAGVRQFAMFEGIADPLSYLKREGLTVSVGRHDDLIRLSSMSPNSTQAAALVNAVIEAYVVYQTRTQQSTSDKILQILYAEKAKREAELSERSAALARFRQQHPISAMKAAGVNATMIELERLATAVTEARVARSRTEIELSQLENLAEADNIPCEAAHGEGSKQTARLVQERDVLEARRADVQRRLRHRRRYVTAEHPDVERLSAEVRRLTGRIAETNDAIWRACLAAARERFAVATAQQHELEGLYQQQRRMAAEHNSELAEYAALESQYERARGSYDVLEQRIRELNVAEDAGALNITVLEPAAAAEQPCEPQKAQVLSIALVVSIALGCGLAIARDRLDHRFHLADQVGTDLDLPVLGVVSGLKAASDPTQRATLMHAEPQSAHVQPFRAIRTSLLLKGKGRRTQVMLLTSPTSGDGKTTLVSNIAIAMAEAGKRVLLIDADLRKCALHRVFTMALEPGLAKVLTGRAPIERAIRTTYIERLDLLSGGSTDIDPSRLFHSPQFEQTLAALRSRYDHICIDAPPVLPVSDAYVLAALSDGVVLVVRAGKSRRRDCIRARDGLLGVGANILGLAVNDANARPPRYAYYRKASRAPARSEQCSDSVPLVAASRTAGGNGNGRDRKHTRSETSENR